MKTTFAFLLSPQDPAVPAKQVPELLSDLALISDESQLAEYQGYFYFSAPKTSSKQDSVENHTLNFAAPLDGKITSMTLDFTTGQIAYRRGHGGGRKQHIAKACGLKSNWNPNILDATGGLGRDAAELRALGCKLRLIERSPYVASLLMDAIERASQNPETQELFGQGFTAHQGQAIELIEKLSTQEQPDIIYLDPMFPPKNKSAAVKKEMRLVKLLVGADRDADELLPIALKHAKKRVVVKRPSYAPYLNEQKPSMSIESKGNRFDVYLLNPN